MAQILIRYLFRRGRCGFGVKSMYKKVQVGKDKVILSTKLDIIIDIMDLRVSFG